MVANFAEQFKGICLIDSVAVCHSDENGFVDASDFEAMGWNYELEHEMMMDEIEIRKGMDEWSDELEPRPRHD